jgi:hypothetical protein
MEAQTTITRWYDAEAVKSRRNQAHQVQPVRTTISRSGLNLILQSKELHNDGCRKSKSLTPHGNPVNPYSLSMSALTRLTPRHGLPIHFAEVSFSFANQSTVLTSSSRHTTCDRSVCQTLLAAMPPQ